MSFYIKKANVTTLIQRYNNDVLTTPSFCFAKIHPFKEGELRSGSMDDSRTLGNTRNLHVATNSPFTTLNSKIKPSV